MKFKDLIYGEEEINEQVLIDLIESKSIQRLNTRSIRLSPVRRVREIYSITRRTRRFLSMKTRCGIRFAATRR